LLQFGSFLFTRCTGHWSALGCLEVVLKLLGRVTGRDRYVVTSLGSDSPSFVISYLGNTRLFLVLVLKGIFVDRSVLLRNEGIGKSCWFSRLNLVFLVDSVIAFVLDLGSNASRRVLSFALLICFLSNFQQLVIWLIGRLIWLMITRALVGTNVVSANVIYFGIVLLRISEAWSNI